MSPRACFYVTGHGFGHASRDQAVIEELLDHPGWSAEIRTSAPEWVFGDLLGERCAFSRAELDPGVVQHDSFRHDLPATLVAWTRCLEREGELTRAEAAHLRDTGTDLVVADISPLACTAARRAGLPCIALGNFTWDWILEAYLDEEPGFASVVEEVRRLYREADLYLRLPMSPEEDPFVHRRRVGFVARRALAPREEVRAVLRAGAGETIVLISFGGFGAPRLGLEEVARHGGVRCLWDRGPARPPALLSAAGLGLRYSDLVRASDVILTKPGFSIIAEAVAQRIPVAYAPRVGFRESALLEAFLRTSWPSTSVPLEAIADGSWVASAVALARAPGSFPDIPARGAGEVVEAILDRLPGRRTDERSPRG
jgi:hypothetical protein